VVVTNAATSVTTSGATLNGSVNPEGQATTYHFEYGTDTAYGTTVPVPDGSAGSGATAVNESAAVAGLAASTTYHYRIDATNARGTSRGSDQTFTTSSAPHLLAGESNVESQVDNNAAGQAEAFRYTASATGTSKTISFYVDPSNTATSGHLGVYSDSSGHPGTLLGQVSFTPVPGWGTVNLPGSSITSGHVYWLAELGNGGVLAFRDTGSGGSPSENSAQTTLTSLPSTWSSGPGWDSTPASFYVSG
jgi:hypothetical protein